MKGDIDTRSLVTLRGSVNPHATARYDLGRQNADTKIAGVTVYFKPSSERKAQLDALVLAQQTAGSPSYHKWLSPQGYARLFGLSDSDLAKIESWLEQQGFVIDRVANSRNSISFSGKASQIEAAFQTEIHKYQIEGKIHYANATQLSIPATLAGVIQSIRNLDDFRPKPYVRFHSQRSATVNPSFTSSQSGDHYLTPKDVATIYDVNAAYNSGYTGVGQSIAIVGQSEVSVSDIENFQNAAGLTVKAPTLVLVPNSGTAAVSSSDEAESDLDLEYSGAMAPGASIYFVYVGNNSNYGVFDSVQYAIDTNIAPIISMSYGACETEYSSSDYSTIESLLEQGASQGQSIIVASGDAGSTGCYGTSSLSTSQQQALVVDYPASSAYVTGVGGTEFYSADVSSSNSTYWTSATGSDVIGSAVSYIPEQVWNDDSSSSGLSSGGGGTSSLTTRPKWQAGVTGIPSGSYRVVPDISLDSSPDNAGYLYCTSDSSAWASSQTASCNSGFRDSNTQYLTVAGGTSFAAPIFAGMIALINQKENSTGSGVVNSTLYTLAADSTTYASAFHDITSGSNKCTAGSSYCSSAGEAGYSATTGYDEASGLGSIDLFNLMGSWPSSSSSSLETTTTTLSPASSTPSSGGSDAIAITVAPKSSSIAVTPTGTLTITVDGSTATSSLQLSSGSASYTFSSNTSGSHVITAKYSGDSTFAASSGTVTLNLGGSSGSSSAGTFSLAATNLTVAQSNSGSSTITVTSQNSYAGTVSFSLSTSSSSLQSYGCYTVSDVTVGAGGAKTTTLTLYTSTSACTTTGSVKGTKRHSFVTNGTIDSVPLKNNAGFKLVPAISLMLAGFFTAWRSKRISWVRTTSGCAVIIGLVSLSIGCGSSSTSTSTSSDVAKGSYTLTLDGTDTSNSSIAASTTFTLTVN